MRKIKKVLHHTALFEEAKAMAKDVIKAYLASLLKHGEPIPEEGPVEIISAISDQRVCVRAC